MTIISYFNAPNHSHVIVMYTRIIRDSFEMFEWSLKMYLLIFNEVQYVVFFPSLVILICMLINS